MTTTVIKDWILDNAPDSATHYGGTNSDGFYLKKLIDRSGDCWFKCERDSYRWTKHQNIYRLDDIRSLSDIRRVVELEKKIKGTRVMERYDLIVKKVDGYASAKVEKHELGSFVKYVDVMEHIAELEEIVKAVAHIGVDFGYGKYELESGKIDDARTLMEKGE